MLAMFCKFCPELVLYAQVKDAAASGVASFAVLTDGTVWSWGSSKRGQLGLGPGTSSSLPSCFPALYSHTPCTCAQPQSNILADQDS